MGKKGLQIQMLPPLDDIINVHLSKLLVLKKMHNFGFIILKIHAKTNLSLTLINTIHTFKGKVLCFRDSYPVTMASS